VTSFPHPSASRQGRHVQWEAVPPEEESETFVAWVASVEETKRMKPTDKAIFGMASESPGRNASEPSGGLEKIMTPEAELSGSGRRQHDRSRADEAACHSGGVVRGSTVTRACRATGETVLVPPRTRRSQVGRITGTPWKSAEDETAAARLVVARKRVTPVEQRSLAASNVFDNGEAGVR